MTLSDAVNYYERTTDDLTIPIPAILKRAEFHNLYNYFAYELPFSQVWGETQAGNDYFMRRERGLPTDDILQYEAE